MLKGLFAGAIYGSGQVAITPYQHFVLRALYPGRTCGNGVPPLEEEWGRMPEC